MITLQSSTSFISEMRTISPPSQRGRSEFYWAIWLVPLSGFPIADPDIIYLSWMTPRYPYQGPYEIIFGYSLPKWLDVDKVCFFVIRWASIRNIDS